MFSLVAVADEQVVVEVATIGREGMVGLPVYLGATSSACYDIVKAEFDQITNPATE